MKKVLSLVLCVALVCGLFAMSAIGVSAESTKVINNFDDIGSAVSKSWQNGSTANILARLDYTTVDPTYTDGNVMQLYRDAQNGHGGFNLDPSWSFGNPTKIRFQIWGDSTFNLDNAGINKNRVNGVDYAAKDIGQTSYTVTAEPTWWEYTIPAEMAGARALTLFFTPPRRTNVYIDNVTLVYDGEAPVINWQTAYDWETNKDGVTNKGNTAALSTAAAWASIGSTQGLKVTGSYGKKANYISVAMTEEMKAADSIRAAYLASSVNTGGNPAYIGVTIEGVNYFYYTGQASSFGWQYFDKTTFYTGEVNTGDSIVVNSGEFENIDALLFSFGNTYSNFCVDDIQYFALSTGSEPTAAPKATFGGVVADVEAVNGVVTLPTATIEGKQFMAWKDAEGNIYNAGDEVAITEDTAFTAVAAAVELQTGAGIRWAESEEERGIRFETTVSKDALDALGSSKFELGALILPFANYDADITVETASNYGALNVVDPKVYGEVEDNYRYYTGVVDFEKYFATSQAEMADLKLTAVSYVKVTYADGSFAYFYDMPDATNNVRTVAEVARAALADTEFGYTAAQVDILQLYIKHSEEDTIPEYRKDDADKFQ